MTLEEFKNKIPGWFSSEGRNMRTVYYIEGKFSITTDAIGTKFLANDKVFTFSKLNHEDYDVGYGMSPYIGPAFILPLVSKDLEIKPYKLNEDDKHNVVINLLKK